jgi:hypothetical protein
MTRRECKTTYKASWNLEPGRLPEPPHRIYELTLVVPRRDFSSMITIAFVLDGEKSSCVQDFMVTLEPRLLALRIDIDPTLGTVIKDGFGKNHITFGTHLSIKADLRSDQRAVAFLNKVASLIGYPSINRYEVLRQYEVRIGADGNSDARWVNEGWWLAKQSGAEM